MFATNIYDQDLWLEFMLEQSMESNVYVALEIGYYYVHSSLHYTNIELFISFATLIGLELFVIRKTQCWQELPQEL